MQVSNSVEAGSTNEGSVCSAGGGGDAEPNNIATDTLSQQTPKSAMGSEDAPFC